MPLCKIMYTVDRELFINTTSVQISFILFDCSVVSTQLLSDVIEDEREGQGSSVLEDHSDEPRTANSSRRVSFDLEFLPWSRRRQSTGDVGNTGRMSPIHRKRSSSAAFIHSSFGSGKTLLVVVLSTSSDS